MQIKKGRPKRLPDSQLNIGTYRISLKAWEGLRKVAFTYAFIESYEDARGVTTLIQALANIDAKFSDNRPTYLRELDPIAHASYNATVWHNATERAYARRISNLPKEYLLGLSFEHNILSRARQATVARGLDLHRPRSYAPSNTSARVGATLEAIGMGYLSLTHASSMLLRPLPPKRVPHKNSLKLIG